MNLKKLFEHVEGNNFSAFLNAASGFKVFQMALEHEAKLQHLIDELRQRSLYKQMVYDRIVALLPESSDPECEHPYDAALAGYLYALNRVNSDLTQTAIEKILQTDNLWWARRLAEHIQVEHVQDLKGSFSWSFDFEDNNKTKSPANIINFRFVTDISDTREISVNKAALSSQVKEYVSPKQNSVDTSADSEPIEMLGVS